MGKTDRTIGIVLLVIGLINLLNIPILAGLVSKILNAVLVLVGLYLIITKNN